MAWYTGDEWGLTEMRSPGRMYSKNMYVITVTTDALEAWWPPTFRPVGFGRSLLA